MGWGFQISWASCEVWFNSMCAFGGKTLFWAHSRFFKLLSIGRALWGRFHTIIPQTAKHWGSNLKYRQCVCRSLRSDARCCDAGSGVVSPACLPVSQSLRSNARCCGGSAACLAVCGKVSAVTLAAGSCLPLVSLCLPRSLRSDARCCDAGCGVVSPACLPVSPSLCGQMLDVVSPACLPVSPSVCGQMSCLPLVSLSPSLSVKGQML